MKRPDQRINGVAENVRPRAKFRGNGGYGAIDRTIRSRAEGVTSEFLKRGNSVFGRSEGQVP
jgi:hypothetical protein